jgi:mannose-6-phosphate isomerase
VLLQTEHGKANHCYDDAPVEILGTEVLPDLENNFRFKYLDAREDLSIQVHPNDELAKHIFW